MDKKNLEKLDSLEGEIAYLLGKCEEHTYFKDSFSDGIYAVKGETSLLRCEGLFREAEQLIPEKVGVFQFDLKSKVHLLEILKDRKKQLEEKIENSKQHMPKEMTQEEQQNVNGYRAFHDNFCKQMDDYFKQIDNIRGDVFNPKPFDEKSENEVLLLMQKITVFMYKARTDDMLRYTSFVSKDYCKSFMSGYNVGCIHNGFELSFDMYSTQLDNVKSSIERDRAYNSIVLDNGPNNNPFETEELIPVCVPVVRKVNKHEIKEEFKDFEESNPVNESDNKKDKHKYDDLERELGMNNDSENQKGE